MSGHTPGPWHWTNNDWWGGYSGIVGPNNEEVLFPQTSNDGDTGAAWFEEISEADTNLIAAAPDLLKACKSVRTWIMEPFTAADAGDENLNPAFRKALRKVNAAIARAEGRTPDTGEGG